jgi:hypothetical protein
VYINDLLASGEIPDLFAMVSWLYGQYTLGEDHAGSCTLWQLVLFKRGCMSSCTPHRPIGPFAKPSQLVCLTTS